MSKQEKVLGENEWEDHVLISKAQNTSKFGIICTLIINLT